MDLTAILTNINAQFRPALIVAFTLGVTLFAFSTIFSGVLPEWAQQWKGWMTRVAFSLILVALAPTLGPWLLALGAGA